MANGLKKSVFELKGCMQKISPSDLKQFKNAAAALDKAFSRAAADNTVLTPYKALPLFERGPEVKTILAEEICEMALPAILDNGRNYLLSAQLRNSILGLADNTRLIKDKFSILSDAYFITYLTKRIPEGYGFIAYPGYMLMESKDFAARFPVNPERYFEYTYPVVYELEGLRKYTDNSPIPGWMAFFFAKPAKMPEQTALVKQKILEAVSAVERLNGRLIGLGGLSASLTKGGEYLLDKTSAHVTTGHGYTIANIINTMLEAAKSVELSLKDTVIAVVGAAGSVGSGIARMSATQGIKQLILIDHRSLESTIQKVRQVSNVPVSVGSIAEDIGKAHIVLIATSSQDVIFNPGNFRPGAIILDDSQPKNVAKNFISERPDIIVLEAGTVQLPKNFSYKVHRAFGPKLKHFHWDHINTPMAGKDEVPCCLAEVMLWSSLGENRKNYSIGRSDPKLAEYLNAKGKLLGFNPAPLQSFGENVNEDRLNKVREIHKCAQERLQKKF